MSEVMKREPKYGVKQETSVEKRGKPGESISEIK